MLFHWKSTFGILHASYAFIIVVEVYENTIMGLVPFRLLPFHLLTTVRCHFAYSCKMQPKQCEIVETSCTSLWCALMPWIYWSNYGCPISVFNCNYSKTMGDRFLMWVFSHKNGVYLSQSFHSTTCHGVCHNQCKGAVTTKEDKIISSRSDEHNHPPNEAEIVACIAVEKMKQQVQEKIDPVPAIYQQQLRELSPRELPPFRTSFKPKNLNPRSTASLQTKSRCQQIC